MIAYWPGEGLEAIRRRQDMPGLLPIFKLDGAIVHNWSSRRLDQEFSVSSSTVPTSKMFFFGGGGRGRTLGIFIILTWMYNMSMHRRKFGIASGVRPSSHV